MKHFGGEQMSARQVKRKTSSNKGVFLFFVSGLFLLQIIFAFTIHGDIGPQYPTKSLNPPESSKLLLGKIETIVKAKRIQPIEAIAPASKKIMENPIVPVEKAGNKLLDPKLRESGGRFLEYVINRGDSLNSIAYKLYKDQKMITVLARVNRITNERSLRCGQVLRIPRQGLLCER